MREVTAELETLDTTVIVVATGAAWQAEQLMADGYPYECLVDPHANLYRALGIGRVGFGEWFRPSTIRRYLAAFRRGSRQGRITGDWRRLSGVALISPDRTVQWTHIADGVGDYPSIPEVHRGVRDHWLTRRSAHRRRPERPRRAWRAHSRGPLRWGTAEAGRPVDPVVDPEAVGVDPARRGPTSLRCRRVDGCR